MKRFLELAQQGLDEVDAAFVKRVWRGAVTLLLLTTLVIATFALYLVLTFTQQDLGPIPQPPTNQVVPASGPQGFPVAVFCDDELTEVRASIAPDVGVIYELVRTRDGATESVVWVPVAGELATHYPAIGEPQQAVVNAEAQACILRKVGEQ